MPKENEITQDDCPLNKAEKYPRKFTKNNLTGTTLSKEEYKETLVKNWVQHFYQSEIKTEKYQNTPLAHKSIYLMRHLDNNPVKQKEARALIIKAEVSIDTNNRQRENEQEEDLDVNLVDTENAEVELQDKMDQDETEDNNEDMEVDVSDSAETRTKKEILVKEFLCKTDTELFGVNLEVPIVVEKSRKYIERKRNYIISYMETNDYQDSQEVLDNLSQAPKVVKEVLKQKLQHLTREEKANRVLCKTLSDTLTRLKETPGAEARKQVQIVLAAISHHTWGLPALKGHSSWRLDKEAREMKVRLLTGVNPILTPPPKAKKDIYPVEVKELVEQHWMESTIPEPSVRRRMKRNEKEGAKVVQSVPTRWQHLSHKEQYSNFKEELGGQVEKVMTEHAHKEIEKISKRPDSDDKTRRLEVYQTLPKKIPGEKYYRDQKPPEVKPLQDHTTGLCRVCEAGGLNYETLTTTLRRLCSCGSNKCPSWLCLCREGDDQDQDEPCSCACSCEACNNCQVNNIALIDECNKSSGYKK